MSTRTVRIVIEDKATQTLNWYASYECDEKHLEVLVDGSGVKVDAKKVDDLITSMCTTVAVLGLACEMYKAYTDSSGGLNYRGEQCPKWNDLPQETRKHWAAVASRAMQLGMLYTAPLRHSNCDVDDDSLTAPLQKFDYSDVDMNEDEG